MAGRVHQRYREVPRCLDPIDEDWDEVVFINSYAVFMGYLSMAVRGLAFLVFTWTTVVLLGGFVTMLDKKDLWSLVVIALVQTAGVFDVFMREKLGHIWNSYQGLFMTSFNMAWVPDSIDDIESCANLVIKCLAMLLIGLVKAAIQALVFTIILFPLGIIYTCGLYISTVVSLWRLIQHDYGNTNGDDDSKANLKPALNLLYSIALVQGVVFFYRARYASVEKGLVRLVAASYRFDDRARKSVRSYLEETRAGCEKDPTFAKGRNLITYAVELMKSESFGSYLSGARILDTLVAPRNMRSRQHILIKQLIGLASSSQILQQLLEALDCRSPHDAETRERAARIVAHFAGDIRLEQCPRGIQCITSLLSEEYRLLEPYERDFLIERFEKYETDSLLEIPEQVAWIKLPFRLPLAGYKDQVQQALRILSKLAANRENCRIMCHSQGLLSKIMEPASSNELYSTDHEAWSGIVKSSLDLASELMIAMGKTGAKVPRGEAEAVSNLDVILNRDRCDAELQKRAMETLIDLSADTSTIEGRGDFIKVLTAILIDEKKNNFVRKMAGQKLVDLCTQYEKDNECLDKLKKALTDVMPKILSDILRCGSRGQEERIQTGTEENNVRFSPSDADLEKGPISGDNGQNNVSFPPEENKEEPGDRTLREALLSLCVTVSEELISADPALARQLDDVAATMCTEQGKPVRTFASLLKEARELLDTIEAHEMAIVPASS